jgi:hypothetical protein
MISPPESEPPDPELSPEVALADGPDPEGSVDEQYSAAQLRRLAADPGPFITKGVDLVGNRVDYELTAHFRENKNIAGATTTSSGNLHEADVNTGWMESRHGHPISPRPGIRYQGPGKEKLYEDDEGNVYSVDEEGNRQVRHDFTVDSWGNFQAIDEHGVRQADTGRGSKQYKPRRLEKVSLETRRATRQRMSGLLGKLAAAKARLTGKSPEEPKDQDTPTDIYKREDPRINLDRFPELFRTENLLDLDRDMNRAIKHGLQEARDRLGFESLPADVREKIIADIREDVTFDYIDAHAGDQDENPDLLIRTFERQLRQKVDFYRRTVARQAAIEKQRADAPRILAANEARLRAKQSRGARNERDERGESGTPRERKEPWSEIAADPRYAELFDLEALSDLYEDVQDEMRPIKNAALDRHNQGKTEEDKITKLPDDEFHGIIDPISEDKVNKYAESMGYDELPARVKEAIKLAYLKAKGKLNDKK